MPTIRDILQREPESRHVHLAIREAEDVGKDAAKRLVMAGREGDIVLMTLGKNGKIHVKDYGRTDD